MKKKTHRAIPPTKIKIIILSLVIAIVLASFVVYLIQTIHQKPEWDDFCDESARIAIPEDRETFETKQIPDYQECQKNFDTANDKYRLIVFIVALITGLIAISIGIMLHLPSVSSGLMLGGTFLVFYGTIVYWSNLTNWFRTIILGIALVILIWLGYKKLQN
jgi:hypothetical protein